MTDDAKATDLDRLRRVADGADAGHTGRSTGMDRAELHAKLFRLPCGKDRRP
jgi:hypothetical protein